MHYSVSQIHTLFLVSFSVRITHIFNWSFSGNSCVWINSSCTFHNMKIPRNNTSIKKLLQEDDFAIRRFIPFANWKSSNARWSSSRYVESRFVDSKLLTETEKFEFKFYENLESNHSKHNTLFVSAEPVRFFLSYSLYAASEHLPWRQLHSKMCSILMQSIPFLKKINLE